ncbi:gfo/Idh/MocA family oxidoreductase [Streptomyces radicis]|uniref:Gfo/Idh/MocA family oxidoreductase n=2 Tax=Streptomyces radicis TaxID=1750517 RepID=A0A3A9VRT1_9ACTN|nr:gfo/Idh/MocA family oxidoreductase [Streptomyces radicis]RKN13341.1 gfo/Idh/MocA family oxidoreductase [Streptomyces radicis]
MSMLPTLLADERVVIAGVADIDATGRDRFAADLGVPAYDRAEDLAANPGVDAVYLATPHALHADQATAALALGTHVLVEKPLSLTVEDCLAVHDASRASGAQVVVGHTHAFDRPVRMIRDIIASGRLGRVAMINSWYYGSFLYRPRRPEELDTARGGGILFNQVPHQVDVVRLLGGGLVRSVRSATFVLDLKRPTEGSHSTFLEFEDGAAASLVYSGYDRFDTDEWHGWIDENGRDRVPEHGAARRALRAAGGQDAEAGLKAARGYRGLPAGPADRSGLHQPHFGVLLVSCEGGDLRAGPDGVILYDDEGVTTVRIPCDGPFPDKSLVIDDLYRVVVLGEPSVHDAAWGAATVEVCRAIQTSAREHREVLTEHQVPVDPARRPPHPAVST